MADNDGSVIIEVNLSIDDAEKEAERLKKKILRLEESLTVGTSKKNTLVEKLKAAEKELEEIQGKTTISGGKAFISSENITRISELKNTISEINNKINKQNEALENTQMELDGVKTRYGEIAKETSLPVSAAEQAKPKIESISEKMKVLLSSLGQGVKEVGSALAKFLISGVTKAVSGLKSLTKNISNLIKNGLKKIISYASKAGESVLSLFKSSQKMSGAFSDGIKNTLKYTLGIRSLFTLFNKLRTALTDGIKNLVQFSSSTNKSISLIQSALTELKNSVATAFEPILTIVSPILTQFINMVSRAADAVARLTAMLSGQKAYTKAITVQEDYAESLEGTANAATEATKSLTGFDEINQLASASSSGGEISPSEMFEITEIEPLSFASWGEAFSEMLDSILIYGIPRLEEALSNFADWFNSFSENLYEMFTFPGIYDKVAILGIELANTLNGLVSQIDWAMLGGSLGAGLNIALNSLVSFVYAFDWLDFGSSLAIMVNNAIAKVNWNGVGQFLWAKFKIAIETLAGFLLNLDMPQLAQAAGNIAISFFDSMVETIQGIDWYALGEQVKAFLVNVDWNSVATAVFTAIGTAFGAATEFLWGLIHDAWEKIVNWWHEVAYEDGEFTLGGLLEGIDSVLSDIGAWIKKHIFEPFMNGFKSIFGIHSPSTVMAEMGRHIMGGLKNGITGTINDVIGAFSGLWTNIKKWWSANVAPKFTLQFWKDKFSTIGEGLKQSIKNGINGAITLMNKFIGWVNEKLNISWDSVTVLGKEIVPAGRMQLLKIPPIPMLAQGAVIPPNREFMAVLGDQKRGNNIEAPEDLIRQIVREESASGDNTQTIQLLIQIIALLRGGIDCDFGTSFNKMVAKANRMNERLNAT